MMKEAKILVRLKWLDLIKIQQMEADCADLYGEKKENILVMYLKISGDGSKFVTRNQGPENVIKVYRYNQDNVCPEVDNDEYDVAYGTFKDFTTLE